MGYLGRYSTGTGTSMILITSPPQILSSPSSNTLSASPSPRRDLLWHFWVFLVESMFVFFALLLHLLEPFHCLSVLSNLARSFFLELLSLWFFVLSFLFPAQGGHTFILTPRIPFETFSSRLFVHAFFSSSRFLAMGGGTCTFSRPWRTLASLESGVRYSPKVRCSRSMSFQSTPSRLRATWR